MKRTIIYDILIFLLIIAILTFVKTSYLNVLFSFTLILIYSYKKQGLKTSLGFTAPKNILKLIAAAFGLAICIVFLSYFILLQPIQKLTGYSIDLGVFGQLKNNSNLLFISLIGGWVIGGLAEETIFRGFMVSKFMNHLNHKTGAIIGIIFSSILFGYLHAYQGPSGQVLTGIMGLMLAIIYVISKRNLWLNIFTHGFINTISMMLLYFDLINLN